MINVVYLHFKILTKMTHSSHSKDGTEETLNKEGNWGEGGEINIEYCSNFLFWSDNALGKVR